MAPCLRLRARKSTRNPAPYAQPSVGPAGRLVKPLLRAGRRLFGLGLLVARPAAGEARESLARLVVHERPGALEDRPLEGRRRDHLAELDAPVLGRRRLLVVDHAPQAIEQLLAEEARD